MPFITGAIVLDAPASALNNGGSEAGELTNTKTIVKKIRIAAGSEYSGAYVYVSAQSFRYWLRQTLDELASEWKTAPVLKWVTSKGEVKTAHTDGNPALWWDDDLLGYMRVRSSEGQAEIPTGTTKIDEKRDLTRISPFRVGTFVSVTPAVIKNDFGTMTRQDGNPVIHEHEFYRAHLLGLVSLDLTAAGTFFDGERTGFKNLDSHRREDAKKAVASEVVVRGQKALRLPLAERVRRVSALVGALAHLNGGAKQTIHYTDLTPAIMMLAVTRHGNNPFYRMLTASRTYTTQFHKDAFTELIQVYEKDFLSPIYIGWAQGFLDDQRMRLEETIQELGLGSKVTVAHP